MVLSKAMEVFWRRGYEAASLAELLQNMGISRKSMYDTFGNKQALFLKALEHYAQTNLREIKEQLLASGFTVEEYRAAFIKYAKNSR